MLIKLTSFDALDPHADGDVMEIDATQIISLVPSHTGDGHDYTTVSLSMGGGIFMVKETIAEIDELRGN